MKANRKQDSAGGKRIKSQPRQRVTPISSWGLIQNKRQRGRGKMTGISHPAPCPGWQQSHRLNSAELGGCRVGSPVCTLRGKGAGFQFAALCHLLCTVGLLPSVWHVGVLQEVSQSSLQPRKGGSRGSPALTSQDSHFPRESNPVISTQRDPVPNGTKEHSDNGGGRKAAGRKGTEPNLCAPFPKSVCT